MRAFNPGARGCRLRRGVDLLCLESRVSNGLYLLLLFQGFPCPFILFLQSWNAFQRTIVSSDRETGNCKMHLLCQVMRTYMLFRESQGSYYHCFTLSLCRPPAPVSSSLHDKWWCVGTIEYYSISSGPFAVVGDSVVRSVASTCQANRNRSVFCIEIRA